MADLAPASSQLTTCPWNRPPAEGDRLYCQLWGWDQRDVHSCFLWRIERVPKTGQLVLVAEGIKKRLPLTQQRLSKLVVYEPAGGMELTDFPEEWGWWRAHGWGVLLRKTRGFFPDSERTMEVQLYKGNKRRCLSFCTDSWEFLVQSPHGFQRLFAEGLYYILHPRKAKGLGVLGEYPMPGEVYIDFVQEMRRKMKKLGLS